MPEVSRRAFLRLSGLGAMSAVVGFAAPSADSAFAVRAATARSFRQPKLLRSRRGSLEVTLTAARTSHQLAGRAATTLTYNGGIPGPTLVLSPGDTLRIRLVNQLDQPTNLHPHGLHVSPRGASDNPFVSVGPGTAFRYEYRLPRNHPTGVFWYHPHHHGMVADQVFGGLYGAIIVRDEARVPVTRQRVMVVSDITLDTSGQVAQPSQMDRMLGREGDLVLVNGMAQPVLTARPGQRERWRVVNACSSRYLLLDLEGHEMRLVGMDLGQFRRPQSRRRVLLAPGNRADLLVTATRGRHVLRSLPYDRGGSGGMGGDMGGGSFSSTAVPLVTFDVSGTGAPALAAVRPRTAARDLRGSTVARRRQVALTTAMGPGGMAFSIDGKAFDHDRIDQVAGLGSVEEWTIVNEGTMDHPFHLHVWPMQVVESNGARVRRLMWQDVVNVPAGGSVKVRIPFERFTGKTVYHCHILDHEDQGMMAVIDVRRQ